MSGKTAANSASMIVDMVCDVCRNDGFNVEKNVQAATAASMIIDVVASRSSGSNTQRVAFECWEGDRPINGREVENFVRRLQAIGVTSGICVSAKGFTGDAEFIARKLGVELWDLRKLRDQLEKIKPPEAARIPGTLPVLRGVSSRILESKLENATALKVTSLPRLEFRPYYFATFEVAGGKKGPRTGVVVLDGVDGRVCDAGVLEGTFGRLPSTGLFLDCLELEPSVGSMPSLSPELEMKNSVTIAPAGVAPDKVMTIAVETLAREAGIDPENIRITNLNLLHVPIVTVDLSAGERSYRKILQAATGRMIWDETLHCSFCEHASKALCDVCGGTTCGEHSRACVKCQRHLCSGCVTTKGVLSKQPLCPTCKQA